MSNTNGGKKKKNAGKIVLPEELSEMSEQYGLKNDLKRSLYDTTNPSKRPGMNVRNNPLSVVVNHQQGNVKPQHEPPSRKIGPNEIPEPLKKKPRPNDKALDTILGRDDFDPDESFGTVNFPGRSEPSSKQRALQKLNPIKKPTSAEVGTRQPRRGPFWWIDKLRKGEVVAQEFVYLNRVTEDEIAPYNPYNLEIVVHANIRPDDYYTLSATGVTHIMNGEAGTI
jgi:hypothetical protein